MMMAKYNSNLKKLIIRITSLLETHIVKDMYRFLDRGRVFV